MIIGAIREDISIMASGVGIQIIDWKKQTLGDVCFALANQPHGDFSQYYVQKTSLAKGAFFIEQLQVCV